MNERKETSEPGFVNRITEAIVERDLDLFIATLCELDNTLTGIIGLELQHGSQENSELRESLKGFMDKARARERDEVEIPLGDIGQSQLRITTEQGAVLVAVRPDSPSRIKERWMEVR